MKKSEFKKYPKYKHSGIEWIGEIPEGWEVRRLKYEAKIQGGFAFKSEEFSDEGIPIIRIGDISSKIDFNNCKKTSETNIPTEFKLRKYDTLIALSGATIGKMCFISEDFESYINQRVASVNNQSKCLHYFLNSEFFVEQIFLSAGGSAQENISTNTIGNFFIPKPPKSEQTAIANYLDDKAAKIDSLIEKKKKLIELCKEERTAVINEAVTKGLNHDSHDLADEHDKKNHGNPLIKLNQGSDTKMKDSGIDWLGQIPQHWEVKKLKYVGNIVLGKMLTNDDKGGYYLKPYLRAANLQWFKVNVEDVKEMWFSEAELEKLRIEEFDLLVSEGGEVGRTCIWQKELEECFIQNSVHKITIEQNQDPLFFLYLMYYLGSIGLFESIVNRISIAHLTGEKIKDIPVWHPHKTEQHQIVQYIEAETKRIDGKIARTEKEIELLREYRTALISEVVTGKIKVC
ncbi:MAG TPA: restriction endonuclease subunit S [Ignavibacteriaceae bacterium]|nr:restriction endonuclease subunit S [Ignavibacteriaceae bacterium]